MPLLEMFFSRLECHGSQYLYALHHTQEDIHVHGMHVTTHEMRHTFYKSEACRT